jgi:hypothetical protein
MRHTVHSFLILSSFFMFASGNGLAGVKAIWAVNDGEKIERDDLNNPNRTSNSAWDGKTVKLFAARNEVVAFQLIIEADGQGISALSAVLPKLTPDSGDFTITYSPPDLDPSNYVDRPIQLLSEN